MQEHHQIEQKLDSWANNLAVGVVLTAQYNIPSNLYVYIYLGFIILSAHSTLPSQTDVGDPSYNYLPND